MLIEVVEKDKEKGGSKNVYVDAGFGCSASSQWHNHGDKQNDQDELDHLSNREISFPPQVFSNAGTHGGKAVIRIHDYVDNGVDDNWISLETTSFRSEEDPSAKRQTEMVNDV